MAKNQDFYKKLGDVEFFKMHKSYIPFIGEKYDKFKILQISESHYCDDKRFINYKNKLQILSKWFEKNEIWNDVESILKENGNVERGFSFTQRVCNDVIAKKEKFRNFSNVIKVFADSLAKKYNLSEKNEALLDYFAFMNFYQFPALQSKGCFPDTVQKAIRDEKDKENKGLLELVRKESANVVNKVIKVLNPNIIIFTSFDAGDSYWNYYENECKNNDRYAFCSHPGNLTWYRRYSRLNNKGENSAEICLKAFKKM